MKKFLTSGAYVISPTVNQRYVYAMDAGNPELIFVDQLRIFLERIGYSNFFPYFDNIRIGTIHPFAILIAEEVLGQEKKANVFPSITVGDSSSDEDAEIIGDGFEPLVYYPKDLAVMNARRAAKELYISDDGWTKINEVVDSKGYIVGVNKNYHTTHSIDLNIWTENKEVTSFLFDMMGHFVTQERTEMGKRGITMGGIGGRRSGDINLDFGMLIYGGNLRVTASMNHESVLFDTAINTIADVDTTTLPTYFTLEAVDG